MPTDVSVRAAIRTAICLVTTAILAFSFHLPSPYWSCMTVIIVSQRYHCEVIAKGFMRLLGTVIGAAVGYFLAGLVVNSFYLFLLGCFGIVSFGFYGYRQSRYPYAYLLAMLTTFLITAEAILSPSAPFQTAIWRPTEIGLGIIISSLGALTILPNFGDKRFKEQCQQLNDNLTKLITLLSSQTSNTNGLQKTLNTIRQLLVETRQLLTSLHFEIAPNKAKKYQAFLSTCQQLTVSFVALSDNHSLPFPLLERMKIPHLIRQLQHCLPTLNEQTLTDPHQTAKYSAMLSDIKKNYLRLRHQNKLQTYRTDELMAFHQSLRIFKSIRQLLVNGPHIEYHSKKIRIRRDPDVLKQSIKAGLTAVVAVLLWLVSNWPSGIQGIISSLIISQQRNVEDVNRVSMQRFCGCLIGGFIALNLLAATSMNLSLLLIILFFICGFFQYLNLHLKTNSYIFLQANIAIVITLVQAYGPPTSLAPPLQRLAGIFIGILASTLVANSLWRHTRQSFTINRLKKLYALVLHNLNAAKADDKLHDLTPIITLIRANFDKLPLSNTNENYLLLFNSLTRIHRLIKLQAFAQSSQLKQSAQHLNIDLKEVTEQLLLLLEDHSDRPIGWVNDEKRLAFNQKLSTLIESSRKNVAKRQLSSENFNELMGYLGSLKSCAQV